MIPNRITLPLRRWLAGVLAVIIGLGPLAAYAGPTPLGDQPLNIQNSAQPNIVLTVDDSTSMLFDFLPDYVASNYCRGGLGGMTAACGNVGAANDFTAIGGGKYFSPGYTYQQYSYPYSAYTGTYDASGPGAGCFPGAPPTCSPGIDPGALPGTSVYPAGPNASWPNAGKPYEYWLLWPAPPHSAALNALYYDPRLTYDPPVDSTGVSYPQMDAGNTSNWTQVPADPWASTITYVDLTASVNVGLWCNSDWTLGLVTNDPTDPNYGKYCRVNGSGASAFGTVTAAQGADYTYPWAPPGFNLSASPGATPSTSYAGQKVTVNASLIGTGTTAAWANAQNAKYFYENENILWCDPTSPSWPQNGAPQTCGNYKAQNCSAFAGLCQNPVNGSCKNAPTCNGLVSGTCSGYQPPLCQGSAGVCNGYVAPACTGGACVGSSAQTCNGTLQSCVANSQTCSGPLSQVCNLPGTQTCVGTITYDPPGCNLLPPDPENPCTPIPGQNCTPDPGKCSIQTGKTCTANSDCTPQPGACSLTGLSCMQPSDCPNVGRCNLDSKTCSVASDCAIIGGTCSKTAQACAKNSDCPASGNCQQGGAVCLKNADCPGNCNNPPNASCMTAATCPAKNGLCSDGVTVCQSSAQCPLTGGLCQTKTCVGGADNGKVCTANNQCSSNSCNSSACTVSGTCPQTLGKCTAAGGKNGNACTTAADCLTSGVCSNTGANCNAVQQCPAGICNDNVTACYVNQDCPKVGMCNTNGASCVNNNQCPPTNGVCSITNQACTTPGLDLVNCPAIGSCSVTGGQCTSNASCPLGPNPVSGATCSTGGVGGVATATLRNDAENNGVVCRRNNKTSGTYTSGPYDYPSGKYLTPISGGSGPDACVATDHYAAVPRHYWKAEVEWCDKKIATAGDQWLGYGTNAGGTCQPGKDATHLYPRFFQFGNQTYVDNYNTAAFQRVDLDITKQATATYTHNWTDVNGQPQSITRNFAEEMTNYANWFAYYRTRIQAVKTVTSLTFTALDDQYRVGFHTLSNGAKTALGQFDPAKFVDIQPFNAGQKATWFGELFAIDIPLQLDTPTLDAMQRIGDYFLNGSSAELSGSSDPIILSCQKNWHMLFTDGFTNQTGLPAIAVGDQDNTVPAYPDELTNPIPGLTSGNAWPHPFREDPGATASNAASDYSMNYWVTDLRTGGPNATDNVPATAKDPAIWQHLNFAAMSLGTQGKLPVANQSLTENLLASGALQWPQPIPNVWRPDNSGVDDLWHAAINGRGRFVNAGTAAELKLGMGQILQDITNQAGSRSGVGLSSSSISLSNHAVYRVTFQPGWVGTLSKIDIDPVTGAENLPPIWEAATSLSTQLTISALSPTPWFDNRKIATVQDASMPGGGGGPGAAVPFLWNNLSGSQQDSLAPGQPAVGQAVLEYLRGNPTNEGVSLGQFRVRGVGPNGSEDFLGDIVDSQAVYVGAPNFPYLDSFDPGYSGFVSNNASRPALVYIGANDGMVHAFWDTDQIAPQGSEAWAFIPHDLYRPDATGLGALAYQDGALPPFRHHYYVDSTPRIYDANFGGGSADWHSLLVGGLGKGGNSYYALDVTHPEAITSEVDVANQYLWTFTDPDMGCSYGKPLIAKTRAFGGRWLVVVAAGYNNGSDKSVCNPNGTGTGLGKIFFIDAVTGKKLKEMDTGVGTAGSPSGLAYIAGYTKDFHNQLIEQIYGGDLEGNFWRFDVSCVDDTLWGDGDGSCAGLPSKPGQAALMAQFTDDPNGVGNPQPVTTPPEIDVDITNGVDRWVFIGTGRLLAPSDLTDSTIATQQQTFYALRDGTTTTPKPITSPLTKADLVPLIDKIAGLNGKPANGWYDDLPLSPNERIVTPVKAALDIVAYAGTQPQDNPCLTGEPATLYVRTFGTGESLLEVGGNPVAGIGEVQGAVGLDVTIFTDSSGPQSASGIDIRVAVTAGSTGDVVFQHINPPAELAAHRMSWRLLGQ
jgi:type IV pilus assembly protein PilY1